MVKAPYKQMTISVTINTKIMEHLSAILEGGIHGESIDGVAGRLICEGINRERSNHDHHTKR